MRSRLFSRKVVGATLLTKGRGDADLGSRLKALAERYPRYGYAALHDMLRTKGAVVNRKRTCRIDHEGDPQIRTERQKKISRPRLSMPVPNAVNGRKHLRLRTPHGSVCPSAS